MKEVYVSFFSLYGADCNCVKPTNDAPNLNQRSQAKQVDVFRGELKLKPTQEPGRWTIGRMNAADHRQQLPPHSRGSTASSRG